MKEFKAEFLFNDIDDNMYTYGEAVVVMSIKADNYTTAHLVGERLQKVLGADHFNLDTKA